MHTCHKCGQQLSLDSDFSRQSTCLKCGWATRCCLNCCFYDRSKYNECTEPVAERVVDKEKANFCDYFKPSSGAQDGQSAATKARLAAEALFKKKN